MSRSRLARILSVIIVSALCLVAVPAVAAPANPVVSGTVYSSNSGVMPGATVAVSVLSRGTYRAVATIVADGSGHWTFSGKQGAYRFEVSAPRATPETRFLSIVKGEVYSLDVTLQVEQAFGSIRGIVVNGAGRTPMSGAYVWIYRQNADGTWPPTSPGWGTPTFELFTAADGTYAKDGLEPGNYKVRFFTIHTGSQFWQYVTAADAATVLTVTAAGENHSGIEGWFNKP